MRQHKADLLRVLECPAVPLHNNGTDSIIRVSVLLFPDFFAAGEDILSCIGRKGFGIRLARRQDRRNPLARVGTHLVTVRLRDFV